MRRVDLELPFFRVGGERRFRLLNLNRLAGWSGRFDLSRRTRLERRSRRRRRMGLDRRTGRCRLPDLRRRVEFRRLSIVRVLIILLGVLAIRRCLRLAWGAGR